LRNTIDVIGSSPAEFIYSIAEKAIDKCLLDILKSNDSALHGSVASVVVDECHTMETWTGKV
jgi:hypothetical protein